MSEDRIYKALERIEDKIDNMSDRVSDLEIWRAEIKGKIAVVVVILTFGFTLTWDFVKEKVFKG